MLTQAKIMAFMGPAILILLTAIAGYAYTKTRLLSLPIPQSLSLPTVLLPLIAGLTTRTLQLLLHPTSSPATRTPTRPTLAVLSLLAFQLIYETVIVTLSLTYLIPSTVQACGLSEQWKTLFRHKDEGAIRRIQDAFNCCGFNSPRDMAWPFARGAPGQDGFVGPGECQRRLGSNRSCGPMWRASEQRHAGLFFMVALVVFLLKVAAVAALFNQVSSRMPRWMRVFRQLHGTQSPEDEEADPRSVMRGLIDDGAAAADNAVAEVDDEAETTRNGSVDSGGPNRLVVQPSSLLGSGQHVSGEAWGER